MTLALPTDAANYDVHAAWDPYTVYRADDGKPDMVEYLGAWWYSTFYTTGVVPVNGGGSGWALDTNGPAPNYTSVVPDAPTNLHAGYKSGGTVALFWDVPMVEGEGTVSGYNIYQNGSLLGTSTINAFTVTGLQASHTYKFTVEALDQTGASGNYELHSTFNPNINLNPDPMDNPTLTVRTGGTEALSGKYFSPYIDMTLPSTNLLTLSSATHLRDFTLAFSQTNYKNIEGTAFDAYGHPTAGHYDVDSGAPRLAWGGIENTTQPTGQIIQQVKAVEAEGGTVTISIGGYTGFDPAVIATQYADALHAAGMTQKQADAKAIANLTQEFKSLITSYGVHSLDFDIENSVTVNNTRANHMRDLAIKALQATNPDLKVTFTMAVTTHGLSSDPNSGSGDDLAVLTQAKKDGVHIDVVNIMAMDYYDGDTPQAAPFIKADGSYNMLKAAESAAVATHNQLIHMGLGDVKVGVTPMIGQNDDYGQAGYDRVQEFFSIKDARTLEHWAEQRDWIGGLGEWAISRDRAGPAESGPTSPEVLGPEHSGAKQTDWQFAGILSQITKAPVAAAGLEHVSAAAFADESASGHLPGGHLSLPGVDVHSWLNQFVHLA